MRIGSVSENDGKLYTVIGNHLIMILVFSARAIAVFDWYH